MKTKINLSITLLLLMTIFVAGRSVLATTTGKEDTLAVDNVFTVSLPVVEEESYVDDIPFDTRAIALETVYMNLVQPEEEAYIDDIPFNTEEIAAEYNASLLSFRPAEEGYIDDIPFDTKEIAHQYLKKNLVSTEDLSKCK